MLISEAVVYGRGPASPAILSIFNILELRRAASHTEGKRGGPRIFVQFTSETRLHTPAGLYLGDLYVLQTSEAEKHTMVPG